METEAREQIETLINGNISDFKAFIKGASKEQLNAVFNCIEDYDGEHQNRIKSIINLSLTEE